PVGPGQVHVVVRAGADAASVGRAGAVRRAAGARAERRRPVPHPGGAGGVRVPGRGAGRVPQRAGRGGGAGAVRGGAAQGRGRPGARAAGGAGNRDPGRAPARGDLRWTGAAGGVVPGAGQRSAGDPGRRADRQPGPGQRRRGAAGAASGGAGRPYGGDRHPRPVRVGARRRGARAMRLSTLVEEAARTATAQRVSSARVAVPRSAICTATLLTVGRTAAAEEAVLARLDTAGSRLLVVTDDRDVGLVTPAALEVLSGLDTVERVIGVDAPFDVVNGVIGDG